METVLPGLFENIPLAVQHSLWFQHGGVPVGYRKKKCLVAVEHDKSRKVDWMWRANCMAFLVNESKSNGFFLMRTSEEAHLHSPSHYNCRSRGKTSGTTNNGHC
jgi:hypothetical protein